MRVLPTSTREDLRRKPPVRKGQFRILEAPFQTQIIRTAVLLKWTRDLIYHTHNSKRSDPGFPDLVLCRERLIVVEVKRDGENPTPAQERWLIGLARAGVETYLWRPSDWPEIEAVLKRREPAIPESSP